MTNNDQKVIKSGQTQGVIENWTFECFLNFVDIYCSIWNHRRILSIMLKKHTDYYFRFWYFLFHATRILHPVLEI